MSDKRAFNVAFRELRKQGFIARQNYQCCQTCGWAALDCDYNVGDDDNVVFFHRQDADSFLNGNLKSVLFMSWQGDGDAIKRVFESHGFSVEWNGAESERIGILPRS